MRPGNRPPIEDAPEAEEPRIVWDVAAAEAVKRWHAIARRLRIEPSENPGELEGDDAK